MGTLVKDLKAATFEEKEKTVHLMDVVALHNPNNPQSLVSGGAIKPLVELVAQPPMMTWQVCDLGDC